MRPPSSFGRRRRDDRFARPGWGGWLRRLAGARLTGWASRARRRLGLLGSLAARKLFSLERSRPSCQRIAVGLLLRNAVPVTVGRVGSGPPRLRLWSIL